MELEIIRTREDLNGLPRGLIDSINDLSRRWDGMMQNLGEVLASDRTRTYLRAPRPPPPAGLLAKGNSILFVFIMASGLTAKDSFILVTLSLIGVTFFANASTPNEH
uniref:homing endonuclease n=1 Tax=Leptographium wingfieldii TaxID=155675 RepID=UPI0023F53100|nr:homing endonuclease [Leptographium wingfieldii]WDZ67421.1 homing endonuclease [Leptographium wingfieldii]WDZ67468.1 homing endonuclease [Leptographium wingfieldii]WDZ67515.1 homing endonuclease [Leptographium wingfieldii]WDZ67656.1 homing endonuclease [Leptographium wingfieldii]WDZ67703.1 homing endonuclease [Leptographium wingfieldii]